MKKLNLKQLFTDNICSFEVAKQAKAAGITCANTFFAYDSEGGLTDAAWLEQMGFTDFYPAINLALAISAIGGDVVIDGQPIDPTKVELYSLDSEEYPTTTRYYFKYNGQLLAGDFENLVDLLVTIWIKYKKPS